jgi:hypothetical protein
MMMDMMMMMLMMIVIMMYIDRIELLIATMERLIELQQVP